MGRKTLSYGFGKADIAGSRLMPIAAGLAFDVETPWGKGDVRTRVVGAFNASNLLGVLAVLLASGVELERSLELISADSMPPPGRMQRLGGDGRAPLIVIDYAHTPDALEKALGALRSHGHRRRRAWCACSDAAAIAIAANGPRWGGSPPAWPIA